jgi:hypothetical protein
MRKFFILGGMLVLLAGCAYPNSHIDQDAQNGLLIFPDAPAGAHVVLDGRDVGLAENFSGKSSLSVSPGTHRVVVTVGDRPSIDKKYYVGAGATVVIGND